MGTGRCVCTWHACAKCFEKWLTWEGKHSSGKVEEMLQKKKKKSFVEVITPLQRLSVIVCRAQSMQFWCSCLITKDCRMWEQTGVINILRVAMTRPWAVRWVRLLSSAPLPRVLGSSLPFPSLSRPRRARLAPAAARALSPDLLLRNFD